MAKQNESSSGDSKDLNMDYESDLFMLEERHDDKLYYLIGKLSPRAQAVFSGITPCADNYQLIVSCLVDRDKVHNETSPGPAVGSPPPHPAQPAIESRPPPLPNDAITSCNTSIAAHVSDVPDKVTIQNAQCGAEKSIKGTADFKIYSRFNENTSFDVSGLVVDRITDNLPTVPVNVSMLSHISSLPLADESFASPASVDVLLGASIFPHLLLPNMVHSSVPDIPPAIQTVLGYIMMGSVPAVVQAPYKYKFTTACCAVVHESPLDQVLKKFWELEEVTAPPAHSRDDLECEHHFRTTTTRDDSGRYTVALPFSDDVYKLGDSHTAAYRRFLCLERKLEASSALRTAFDDIIREYVNKGYLSESSPFHALRVVHQLIADDGGQFPIAATIASTSTYMDDVCFSIMADDSATNDETVAIAASKELINLFKRGQFDLVKWTCNSESVLREIPASHRASTELEIDKGVPQKILGLHWNKVGDFFYFKVNEPDTACTKRAILSTVARLWDNVGLVAPTILYAKLLIQELWLIKCDWDETPPQRIVELWDQFCAELPRLNEIRIPRHLGVVQGCTAMLLGFGDASERAYGGVVYLRVANGADVTVQLVCSKSKVAPLKTASVARLELCAAVLLSKLMRTVLDNFEPRYKINQIYAFTDSKIVLCWINSSPHRWQTFVANRVVKIVENVPADCFHHVAGVQNPADCLSRGLSPAKLIGHPLWYQGPPWVLNDPTEWPIKEHDRDAVGEGEIPELKPLAHAVTTDSAESPLYTLAQRTSSWSKLLRITVYVCRFLKLLPRRATVSRSDLEVAEKKIITSLQNVHFRQDIQNLKNREPCSPTLQKLHPFLDEDGLIRVGGRLTNAKIDYVQKHPFVFPRRDHVVDMVVDYYHKKHLHAGPELLMSLLRCQYWILAARRVIRHRIHNCNTCFRAKPRPSLPLMADLPDCRVNQAVKPFTHTGCDYAGPIQYTPVVGQQILSYEELLTVLAQVEALVNSRPLTAMSSDPAEPAALTPAHFLHTAPLLSLPTPPLLLVAVPPYLHLRPYRNLRFSVPRIRFSNS
ncbi:uncharacterized protein [Choristoneura fumiferana]|uniref:uncharacterized protein n=1 Tax=Choristoneura fumiferana TaxID=7141 RepID=UPI003D159852